MAGSNIDLFWNHVVKMNDGRLNCQFCGHPFTKDTSISRIKWHLSGEKGHGVAICGQVPKQVQEEAFLAMHGGKKRHKSIASSSNVNDHATSTSPQEQSNEVGNLAGGAGRAQAPYIMGHAIERSWREICNLLMEDDLENGTGGPAQPGAGAVSSRGFTCNTNEIKGDALPMTTKLVGQAFEDHKKTIWSWLMQDEVSSVGIYGMGGVGKTTLATHIYNQLLERPDTFCHVYWITVSQDTSINRLQNSIARRIGLVLSNEEEELFRAIQLSRELMKKQKWVLVLDDLWKAFELQKLGIPIQAKGCKLILTTRSKKVCQQMATQHRIKVKPISEEEAWTLFIERLGHDISLSSEVEQIAKSITKECDGLPLGIITMAGTMKGVDDIREWRDALEDLRQSTVRQDDMEEEVFRILRFSYTHLSDSALQQCFLYCALFPEDFKIPRVELIGYLIDEGVIKGLKSRMAEFDKGHSILNRLENVCLLERIDGGTAVKMHDLIRDMAIQIHQENSPVMVKAGARLKELPDAEEWTENLKRVSLMYNQIQETPSRHSPRCPSLLTLLLRNNTSLQYVAGYLFEQLHGLKVLDLSHTIIEKLPASVSDLVCLTALLLEGCDRLSHVPSLKKLRALKRLDLSKTVELKKMPQGMEFLSNLRYLRMNRWGENKFPSGILPKLSHLQVFVLEESFPIQGGSSRYRPITVEGKEVGCLRKLETLECHFEGYSDFVEYLKSRDETQSLTKYRIVVGSPGDLRRYATNKIVSLGDLSINRDGYLQVMFLKDIRQLMISNCHDAKSLCNVSTLIMYATELEVIQIKGCNSMESLVSSFWFCPAPSYKGIFSGLRMFNCYRCRSMKKLFPIILLPNLVNLEEIIVEECEKLEKIIGTRLDAEGVMGEESSSSSTEFKFPFPKLRIMRLYKLPELKSICSAKIICDSLEEIDLWECQKLKRVPICFPLLGNGQPSPPPSLKFINIKPKQWWDSVEWEHPEAKDVVRPFLEFG